MVDYLTRIVKKEAYDKSGLIYGMGHAVYTISDPRTVVLKQFARKLAQGTEFERELGLLESIERLSPEVLHNVKGTTKDVCGNVDNDYRRAEIDNQLKSEFIGALHKE